MLPKDESEAARLVAEALARDGVRLRLGTRVIAAARTREVKSLTLEDGGRIDADEVLVAALSFTPMPRYNYQIGLPRGGHWREVLNSDATIYGGSGQGNLGGVEAMPIPLHGRKWSAAMTLPPLGAVFLLSDVIPRREDDAESPGEGDSALRAE